MDVRGWSELGEEDVDELGTHFMSKLHVDTSDGLHIELAQDPDSDHVGTTTWDAALVLSRLVTSSPELVVGSGKKKLRILELGAGCGLNGIHLALLGHSVVMSDRGESVMDILRGNVASNIPKQSKEGETSGEVTVVEYEWGGRIEAISSSPAFDLVIVADCVYEGHNYPLLVESLHKLATASSDAESQMRVVLANHTTKCTVLKDFMDRMKRAGFAVTAVPAQSLDLQGCNVEGSEGIGVFIASATPDTAGGGSGNVEKRKEDREVAVTASATQKKERKAKGK